MTDVKDHIENQTYFDTYTKWRHPAGVRLDSSLCSKPILSPMLKIYVK
ncbi:hypothetical protein [Bacillus sp. JJ722]